MNPRTPVDELKLQGSGNLKRALNRLKKNAEPVPVSEATKRQVELLDQAIEKTIRATLNGAVRNKKRNPASPILKELIFCRAALASDLPDDSPKPKKSELEELLEKIDKVKN